MKLAVSFSLRKETLAKIQEKLKESNTYRNKSHLVESAIEKYLEKENE